MVRMAVLACLVAAAGQCRTPFVEAVMSLFLVAFAYMIVRLPVDELRGLAKRDRRGAGP